MSDRAGLAAPAVLPPLDVGFRPAVLAWRRFQRGVVSAGGGVPVVVGLERDGGDVSRFETRIYPEDHPRAPENLGEVERLFKFLLWARGGWRAFIGGSSRLSRHLRTTYRADGARAFDGQFMGEDVYGLPFTVVDCEKKDVPCSRERARPIGRHLDGCRIGFDLGGSDIKVCAVIDGKAVFSEEILWSPGAQSDPGYHHRCIREALLLAAAHLPRVDAIGGSAAGVYVDDEARVASLFRGVPKERFGEVRTLFGRIRGEFGVPFAIANDGDVTALAGAMSLGDTAVLGLALGSSLAAGYVDSDGNLTGWLNELAFAPIDLQNDAPADEWSGDRGVGVQYLSQQCVFRLASLAGVAVPTEAPLAVRLEAVQRCLEAGHEGARRIWETMGVYLGYAIAYYAQLYPLRHVLVLGRCTSGSGGALLVEGARRVLNSEFPDLASMTLHLPDERTRRVGQSIAAASLPAIAERGPR